jgi:hypothetical protein
MSQSSNKRGSGAMTLIEILPHLWDWQVYECPCVEPVFLSKEQAIDHIKGAGASTVCKGNNGVTFPVLHVATDCLQLGSVRE